MKTEVYSWRLSSELKSELEREARLRKAPVSSVLELAIRNWLKKRAVSGDEDEEQRRLHEAAAKSVGALAGRHSRRSEAMRKLVRQRLARRYAR